MSDKWNVLHRKVISPFPRRNLRSHVLSHLGMASSMVELLAMTLLPVTIPRLDIFMNPFK
jgi:hypothetical protein